MINHGCSISLMHGYLNTEFILALACRKLNLTPEQIEEKLGRYTKGKRKGELRGKLAWFKCTRGGWLKYSREYMDGTVIKPGQTWGYKVVDAWSDEIKIGYDSTGAADACLADEITALAKARVGGE